MAKRWEGVQSGSCSVTSCANTPGVKRRGASGLRTYCAVTSCLVGSHRRHEERRREPFNSATRTGGIAVSLSLLSPPLVRYVTLSLPNTTHLACVYHTFCVYAWKLKIWCKFLCNKSNIWKCTKLMFINCIVSDSTVS